MRAVVTLTDRAVSRVETVLLALAGLAVAVTAVSVTTGAVARYAFHSPMAMVNELATIYLGPAITFLAMSAALRDGSHIAIDVVARRLPEGVVRVAAVIVYSVSLVVFVLITWRMTGRALTAWETHDVVFGSITWPLFIAFAMVALGSAVLVVRHLIVILLTVVDPAALQRPASGIEPDLIGHEGSGERGPA